MRILLADDHPIVRRIVRNLLQSENGWEVCAEASNGREAVEMTTNEHPDIVVLDLSMPEMNGLQAAAAIHEMYPDTAIIVLTLYDSLELTDQLAKSGVRICVLKSELQDLVSAIRVVYPSSEDSADKASETNHSPESTIRRMLG